MQMHNVQEVREEFTVAAVNRVLHEGGWTLVAIVSGDRHEGGFKTTAPIYVLAKLKTVQDEPGKWGDDGLWIPE